LNVQVSKSVSYITGYKSITRGGEPGCMYMVSTVK